MRKLKRKIAFLLAVVIVFTTAFVFPDFSLVSMAAEDDDVIEETVIEDDEAYITSEQPNHTEEVTEEQENIINETEEISETTEDIIFDNVDNALKDESDINDFEISSDEEELVGSGDYGNELNRQNTLIGITSYLNGSEYSSFNEGLLRFQWDTVYCFDLSKRFRSTDNYTHYTTRPDSFSQENQDVVALIVYYFHNIKTDLDDRPVVQYYYTQCCIWNYLHSVNSGVFPYTAYIQYSETQTGFTVTKTVEEQKQIYSECLDWVYANKSGYTTSIEYWRNNDGDYQPVLKTSVTPLKGKIAVNKSSSNTSLTNGNSSYSLQGAVYGVYGTRADANADTNRVTTITTNESGYGVSGSLDYATYYVKEITASKGYSLDTTIYTAVISSTTQTATVSSSEIPNAGKLRLVKTSANTSITNGNNCYSLQGAVYGVYSTRADANNNTNRITTITTDADGKGESGDLAYGTYYVKEITASKGYSLDSTVYTATINSTTKTPTVNSAEIPQNDPSVIILTKKDSENNEPIEGAVYEVKYYATESENQINDTTYRRHWYLNTDTRGVAQLDNAWLTVYNGIFSDDFYYNGAGDPTFPLGYITIQEVEAPVEYVIDSTLYTYKVTDNMLRTVATNEAVEPLVSERPKKQAFQLIKLAEDGTSDLKPLANAGFMAWKASDLSKDADGNYIFDTSKAVALARDGSKEMFTDEDGYALSAELRYGTYIVRETTVPTGYNPVADFTVTITEDSSTPQRIVYKTDTQKKYYLRVTKIDSLTNNAVLNNSSSYKIWSYDDNAYVSFRTYTGSRFEQVSEFKTDNSGILMTPGTLTYGSYRLVETTAPEGYNMDYQDGIDFTIDDNTIYVTVEDEGNIISIVDVVYEDTPILGRLNLVKTGEVRTWDEASGDFKTEAVPLSGIEFGIYADEDIYTADGCGTLIYAEGDLAYTVTTNEEGKASQDDIPLGKYVVKELNTPEDFIKVEDLNIEFKLSDKKQDADGVYYVEQTAELLNKAYYPKVKTSAKDKATGSHTGVIAEKVTTIDTVECTNLIIGKEYTVKGKMYMETGDVFLDNGKEVIAEKSFKAEKKDMTVELEFTYNSSSLLGDTVVIFEDLYNEQIKIATHSDLTDKEQQIHYPNIGTTLKNAVDGGKAVNPKTSVNLNDTVKIENVAVGDRFILRGFIYDKSTGDKLIIKDGDVSAYNIFVSDNMNMTVDVIFTFDASSLSGKDIVCFEYLYLIDEDGNEILVAEYTDINDMGQTIKFTPPTPKTGDNIMTFILLMLVSAGLIIIMVTGRRISTRRKSK